MPRSVEPLINEYRANGRIWKPSISCPVEGPSYGNRIPEISPWARQVITPPRLAGEGGVGLFQAGFGGCELSRFLRVSGSSPKLTLRRKNGIAVSPRVLDKWPVISTYVFIHRAKLSMHDSAASECGNGCWNHIIRGRMMTGNIPYLSVITWVSLTSIKEMKHSPDEFKVGRWSCHSCLGCQVEGGNLDPSENNIFSVSKCAICSSLIVFKRRHFNSFRGQLSRTSIGSQGTCRSANEFKGDSLLSSH